MVRRVMAACVAALLCMSSGFAETIAITGGRVLTATSRGVIPNGTVIIDRGQIVAVGSEIPVSDGVRVIDATGKFVTPGLVVANTLLGTAEVGMTADPDEAGLRVEDLGAAALDVQYQLNPASTLLPIARLGGITRAIVTPQVPASRQRALSFSGQAAVVHLGQGRNMLVRPRAGMILSLGDPGAAIVALKSVLEDVRAYAANRAAYNRGEMRMLPLSRAELEALVPVAEGRMPLQVSVDRAAEIRQVLTVAREEKLKLILEGAAEGWLVADEIAAAGVPVMLNALEDLPSELDKLAATLDNAARLHAAGVKIVIEADRSGHYARQLRFNAGNAVAHGLSHEAALEAITINPARIWGEQDFGAIAVGQDADLVIWSGDPFEPLSQPQSVWIRGIEQPLGSRHLELRDRYKDIQRKASPFYP